MKTKRRVARKVRPYQRVVESLRQVVAQALERGDSFLGTEVSVAEANKVSRMTARKGVNALIAEGLVERRAGIGLFVRNQTASGFVYRALFGNLFWDPSIKVASAIRRESQKVGSKVEFFDAGGEEARFLSEIAALPKSDVKGAIIFSQHGKAFDAAIDKLAESGFPFVVVDETVAGEDVSSFVSDNEEGGRLAAQALIDAGHRNVAFIGDMAADTVMARWTGFLEACEKAGVKPQKHDIRSTSRLGDWGADVRAIAEKVLHQKVRPTALFCSCDAVARLVMRTFSDHGVRVPDDISLVGFDDDPIAEWMSPALTTVRQDFDTMGVKAFGSLIARVGDPSSAPRRETIPVRLIVRESIKSL